MSDAKIGPEINEVLREFHIEYRRAREALGHAPMGSAHEGYAVILEELDEMWDAIKCNDLEHARKEAVQVGAMVLAFLLEVE